MKMMWRPRPLTNANLDRSVPSHHGSPSKRHRLFLVAACVCVIVVTVRQSPQFARQTVFRSDTRTVAVFATVQEPGGRLVPDLPRDAFSIFDDGRPVEISLFSNEVQPITAVVMLDMSASMSDVARLRGALRHFLATLRPNDRLRIGTFGYEVALSHDLTGDRRVLERVVDEELWPGGTSPLWRAIDTGITALAAEPGRRVVLVLTDGIDHSPGGDRGLPALAGGVSALKQHVAADTGLMIYAVGFGDPKEGRGLSGSIVELGDISGGGHINVSPSADLSGAFARIGEELRRQYVIGFTPLRLDGRVHRVEVRTNRPGLKVRARTSYMATGER